MKKTLWLGGKEYGIVSLAPMAGMGDRPFRTVCRRCGADFLTTEMVSAKAVCYGDRKTGLLSEIRVEELPCAVQLFGSEPETMAKAASILLEDYAKNGVVPSAVDINMGCPMQKVVKCGDGSALMKTPALAAEIVAALVRVCGSVPVTAKLRLGWNEQSINVVEMAKLLEASGLSAVCVHARTREELYRPGVRRAYIRAVKEAVRIPVIGNGDVFSAKDALSLLSETGCDGVAVARGALGNPWIFSEIHAALEGVPFSMPSKKERLMTALSQFRMMIAEKGERVAVAESRAAIAYYTKGMTGASRVRGVMNATTSADEIIEILSHFAEEPEETEAPV